MVSPLAERRVGCESTSAPIANITAKNNRAALRVGDWDLQGSETPSLATIWSRHLSTSGPVLPASGTAKGWVSLVQRDGNVFPALSMISYHNRTFGLVVKICIRRTMGGSSGTSASCTLD